MKVSDLSNYLKAFDPDDEIFIGVTSENKLSKVSFNIILKADMMSKFDLSDNKVCISGKMELES